MRKAFLALIVAVLTPALPTAATAGAGRAAEGASDASSAATSLGGRVSRAGLSVEGTSFVLSTADGRRLTSTDLAGAVFEFADGQGGVAEVRIASVAPSKESPQILLHQFEVRDAAGGWTSMCDPDAYGRKAGFPVRGRWEGRRFVPDEDSYFITCTSGSQAKCILWGYDPWGRAPDGRPLTDFYRACQQMTRADYLGDGEPHTRDGTLIDIADAAGVQAHDSEGADDMMFEAGWGPDGAVCVAATRWPDLMAYDDLIARAPHLGGPCDEAAARRRGALLFTRIAPR